MGTGQMLMGSGEDHTAPANSHFLAGLDPQDWSSSVTCWSVERYCLRAVL